MAQTVCVIVSASDRGRLEAIASDRNRPQKHAERARVVLASLAGDPLQRVAARLGVSRPMIWRWQQRFAEAGVDGLLRDKTRKPGKPPLAAETVARVVALTCAEPPHQATHWTGRAMAEAAGISLSSVQRIWAAHKLQPHRVRSFKRSRDPAFATKLTDIVGLYLDPPAHAVVLSIDEKSQIQALDRTQPGLPMKPGRCGTMTHDYKRHGTTTLFAALNVLDGRVIGRCMQQHRHEEFIRFLNDIERAVPTGKLIEAVVDNYATHKHPKVKAWLKRHPRWTFHFTPTSGSWLNAVENFFSVLTRKRIRRGSFHSLVDLQAAIKRYLAEHNAEPKPFVWKASAASILAKLDRLPVLRMTQSTSHSASAMDAPSLPKPMNGSRACISGSPCKCVATYKPKVIVPTRRVRSSLFSGAPKRSATSASRRARLRRRTSPSNSTSIIG
jgi:transposase